MNVIEAAVELQREGAIVSAVVAMQSHIERELAKLEQAGGDLNEVYAHQRAFTYDRVAYRKQVALRAFIYSITENKPTQLIALPGMPEYRVASKARIEKVLERVTADASASFDAYVAKLNAKVGECVSAKLIGQMWNDSVLTITRAGGEVERWKTQMIINVSVLGKLFNQWPTRKMA